MYIPNRNAIKNKAETKFSNAEMRVPQKNIITLPLSVDSMALT